MTNTELEMFDKSLKFSKYIDASKNLILCSVETEDDDSARIIVNRSILDKIINLASNGASYMYDVAAWIYNLQKNEDEYDDPIMDMKLYDIILENLDKIEKFLDINFYFSLDLDVIKSYGYTELEVYSYRFIYTSFIFLHDYLLDMLEPDQDDFEELD